MDVREKLVEQLREVSDLTPPICEYQEPEEIELVGKKVTAYCKPFEQFQELLREAADYIANGVTVQEWIPVTERLPQEEGWYLVYTTPNREHKSINKAMFCKGYAWGNFEPYWRGAGGHWANVTHWMPLPEPPKGE